MNKYFENHDMEHTDAVLTSEILTLYQELSVDMDVKLEAYVDADCVRHIRIFHPLDMDEAWEICLRQKEEFPLELLINNTREYKED